MIEPAIQDFLDGVLEANGLDILIHGADADRMSDWILDAIQTLDDFVNYIRDFRDAGGNVAAITQLVTDAEYLERAVREVI